MRWLYWSARILMIAYGLFLALFAFDVFDTGSLSEQMLRFLIHLIPTYLVFIALAVAWRWERVGAIFILAISIAFTLFFHTYEELVSFLLVTLPLLVIAVLFWLHSKRAQHLSAV